MLKVLMLPFALLGAACSPPANQDAAKSNMETMDTTSQAAPAAEAAAEIHGVGTVVAIDAGGGSITIDHEAIAGINWPPMQMQFAAEDPAILQGIAVGDHVRFQIKSATETGIVTMLEKQ